MRAALRAVYWEVIWKNRAVFPTVGVLLAVSAVLAWAASQAPPGTAWPTEASRLVLMMFLISVLISFAPFTLMESSGGWRMNSMITRWYALPLRTAHMVFLPVLTGCLFLALIVSLWMPVLSRVASGLDGFYFIAVLCAGQVAIVALAWTVPRRPLQFWVGVGLLFPVVLILAFAPQDQPGMEKVRRGLLLPIAAVSLFLLAFTWLAASRNRCGAWPGELRLDVLWEWLRGGSGAAPRRAYRSRFEALLRAEALPNLRLLGSSWALMVALVFLFASWSFREQGFAFSWKLFPLVAIGVLPVFGMIWMAGWGLFAAGEPSAVFRSRLSSFRATLPVSSGFMAGQSIATLFLGWSLVWLPLVVLSYMHNPDFLGMDIERVAQVQPGLARFMALGAFMLVGALPLYLWGRIEGFPIFLLTAVCVWALSWGLLGTLSLAPEEEPGWHWILLAALLTAKGLGACVAFGLGLRRGHVTWRFPLVLLAGWFAVVALVVWVLPLAKAGGPYQAGCAVLLIPLARLALCPLAVAANRHRS
jgi:hypothetical protein